ncbi:Semaphorin-5B [Liparis tanakae]|uniref:Semaphorin-5B n=1 Tax=Liparis tanakae TaxID=230148 RepID=A0A4Z2E695_9TELE|nr:Semaphorin-5B [Liparis tanakae]
MAPPPPPPPGAAARRHVDTTNKQREARSCRLPPRLQSALLSGSSRPLQAECQNYIRVLLVNKTEVMTCGTNAFQPLCTTRAVGNVSRVLERVNGVARCPYDPRHNSTAVVTESGELYAATVIDFSGRDPVIYRSLGGRPPLRTAQYNSKWLNGTGEGPTRPPGTGVDLYIHM